MDRKADLKYRDGRFNYSISWLLLTFLGIFGVHRFYLGKWITGLLYLCTGGLFFVGYLFDFLRLNEIVSERNLEEPQKRFP